MAGSSDPAPGALAAGNEAAKAPPDVFDAQYVHEIEISIAAPAFAALRTNANNHAYVPCSWREGDFSLNDVGIHCKGDTAKLLDSGKPEFRVTFDKYVHDQGFYGQKRLILQSSRKDPSYLSAPVAFELFRQAGVPAPRCGFARVRLNGRELGLYVINEGETRDFLLMHFGNNEGNLYDEGETSDVTGKLDKDHGRRSKGQPDVDALVAAARSADPAERWQELKQRLDMDRFLAFIAIEVLLWNEDGYALDATDFRLYRDTLADRLVFFPKGVERVLAKTNGPVRPRCQGVIANAVLTTPDGQTRYFETIARLRNEVFVPDKIQAVAREIASAIRPIVGENGAGAVNAFDVAVARFQGAVAERARFVAAELKASNIISGIPHTEPAPPKR